MTEAGKSVAGRARTAVKIVTKILRTREKERGNQEAHPEKEVFVEKMPLFGEPYKTTKRDELSRQIQNILGDYEVMKELWRSMSCTQCPNGSEDSRGKPKYPLFHDRESLASNSCCTHIYHKLFCTSSAPGSPFVGNISHSSKMAPPRMEPVPSLHAKNYGPPNKQHLTRDRLSQEGHSSNHKKCDRRADGDSAPVKKLSPLISPVSHLSPVHSRLQRTRKVYSSSSTSNKGYCADTSPKDLKVKVQDNETPLDTSVVITRLGVASSQTFPPPPLPSESVAMRQKPMTCIWPTDGQNQAPSEPLGLKPPLEDNGQQSFEKLDVKVPAKAKLTRLKISSQSESVEQLFSNEVRCIEEILKEMTHSWLPPLTAKHTPSTAKTKHTPSTAKSSRSPFPTKEPLPNSSATQSQNQYYPPSKIYPNSQQGTSILWEDLQLSDSEESDTEQAAEKLPSLSAPPSAPQILPKLDPNSQQGTSILWEDLQLSDSEESDTEQAAEKLPSLSAPPSAPQILPKPVVSAHSSSAKSENKGENRNTDQLHPESKGSPSKSSSKGVQDPTEGPQPEERSCQKSLAQQESPPQQTIETKQPRKPAKGSGQAEPRACLQVESKPGPLPSESKKQTSKDKPKMKAKGREPKPEARMPNHQAAEPAPKEKRKHKGSPAPSKVPSGPQPPKDKAQNRNSFTPPHSGRGCSGGSSGRPSHCQQTASVREDGQKRDTELLSPLRDSPLPTSLVVKINLDHLTRIPQPLGKGGSPRKAEDRQPPADKKQDPAKRDCNGSGRLSKKRKGSDSEKDRASKKIRREKDVQSHCTSSSSSHTESSKTKTSKPSSESSREEMPSLPPVSASSSTQKSTKTARKKPKPDVDTCGQDPPKSAGSANANDKDSSVPKHRKVPKVQARGSEYKGSSREATNAFLVPSLPKGNCKPEQPQVKPYMQKADFYMKEAKRLKCKAAATTNKIKKTFKYLEAVLSLIECGMAMESESSVKAEYAVYSETADLIKFTMSLKSFSDATVPAQEKIFAVLCLRCQSLVNMAMFCCKKDIVMKYSHSLSDHFNNSSLCTGIPSSLSPVPSPARSVRSQSSADGMTATVRVPVTIQNKTFAYFTITNHLLKALELWEQSEALTKKNKKFFAQLSTKVRILTLNSSLVDLVIYTKQGLQWLKQTLKTP
ncbi:LOW QUALITY PROTEIN: AF4/FMR2 family member 1-like [Microtus oregoni]|uniref:LOW QUALITY PROTEIN: AF4/FMR2 family member 1-like n=1 Tax=Microtus oregoni TaxID=111838 RepID=UPI001BB1CD89|nr:LOW QUALITY PROTEIN: AF4/FMR2 family member 1-like [Microtus oregoni]